MFSFLSPFACPTLRTPRRAQNTSGSWLSPVEAPGDCDDEVAPRRPRGLASTAPVSTKAQKAQASGDGLNSTAPASSASRSLNFFSPSSTTATRAHSPDKQLAKGPRDSAIQRETYDMFYGRKGGAAKSVLNRDSIKSKYQTCLKPDEEKRKPIQQAYLAVEDALQEDARRFEAKYAHRFARENPSSSLGTSSSLGKKVASNGKKRRSYGRYSITLPDKPVHEKFSQTEVARTGRPDKPKFCIQTLRRWFKQIDGDDSGSISRREMIIALRNRKELQYIFAESCVGMPESQDNANSSKGADADDGANAQTNELRNILDILHIVDKDGSGTMEWEEVLEFFRRGGYLLEYETAPHLNLRKTVLRNRVHKQAEMEKMDGVREEDENAYEDEDEANLPPITNSIGLAQSTGIAPTMADFSKLHIGIPLRDLGVEPPEARERR